MKGKSFILVLILFMIATLSFGRTVTNSLYISPTSYAMSAGYETFSDGIVGIGVRTVYCPNDVGFYWGGDIYVGYPVVVYAMNSYYNVSVITQSLDDLFAIIKVPFGYRWPGVNKKGAFYLGIGPSAQSLVDIGNATIISLGIASEMGFQTNKTEGVGFHFGFQAGYSPWIIIRGIGLVSMLSAVETSIHIGLSWRRVR